MKYCQHCGKEVLDDAIVCTNCGCSVSSKTEEPKEDKPILSLVVLSILIPIVGIILWPVKHKETPQAAMTYGITGIVTMVLAYIVLYSGVLYY